TSVAAVIVACESASDVSRPHDPPSAAPVAGTGAAAASRIANPAPARIRIAAPQRDRGNGGNSVDEPARSLTREPGSPLPAAVERAPHALGREGHLAQADTSRVEHRVADR